MSDVIIEMTGNERRAMAALQRMEARLDSVEKKTKDVGRSGKQSGDALAKAGDGAAVSFMSVTKAITAAAGAAGSLLGIMRELRDVEKQAAVRITGAVEGRRALGQIATDSADLKRLVGLAERARTQHGLQEGRAFDLVFKAGSAGLATQENIDLLARLPEIAFNESAAVDAAVKLQAGFGGAGAGRAGGGSVRQIINKALAAAGPSPVNASAIAGSASIASSLFASIGGQDEELLAMLAVMSEPLKSPDAAGERVKSLASQVFRKRDLIRSDLQGLDLLRALPALAEQGALLSDKGLGILSKRPGMTGAQLLAKGGAVDLKTFLGEANAIEASNLLTGLGDKVSSRLADVIAAESATGTASDLLGLRLAMMGQDVESQGVKLSDIRRERSELRNELRFGTFETLADAIADENRVAVERGWPGILGRGMGVLTDWGNYFERLAVGPEAFSRRALGDTFGATMSPSSRTEFREQLDRIERKQAELDGAGETFSKAVDKFIDGVSRLPAPSQTLASPAFDPGVPVTNR